MSDGRSGSFGPAEWIARIDARLKAWEEARVPARIWTPDPTVWPEAPASDVLTRTGWLGLPTSMPEEIPRLTSFAREVRDQGMRHVVVLGMGGSSLAPDVLRRTFGSRPGYPELIVLDSTHPEAVRSVAARIAISRTLFVVSSKSGTTTEPLDFHRYFWQAVRAAGADPAGRFVAVTDPGSPLEALATDHRFRAVFRALPTVGGRYSALTMFGLVPAALIGIDLADLLARAREMAEKCGPSVPAQKNPGLRLGAALGEYAVHGHDKLTFLTSASLAAFPIWAEQLVAESTGKVGRGIVPVVGEPEVGPGAYGPDRLFVELTTGAPADSALSAQSRALEAAGQPVVRLHIEDIREIGAEFFRWELAVAMAGPVLGIDPFDQPDVELAKELARQAMARRAGPSGPTAPPEVQAMDAGPLAQAIREWSEVCRTGDYIAVQAYLAPTPDTSAALERLRRVLLDRLHVATTVGYGPRFLHSTGQLHKGGPNTGLFLQIVDRPSRDLEVPGAGYTFGRLIEAQSVGDYHALRQKGRRIVRVDLGEDAPEGLRRLVGAIRG